MIARGDLCRWNDHGEKRRVAVLGETKPYGGPPGIDHLQAERCVVVAILDSGETAVVSSRELLADSDAAAPRD